MYQAVISRPATHVAPELTDHCDRCGAPAKISVTLTAGGDLAFCGHHANRYVEMILELADNVVVEAGFPWRGTVGA
jgi:hypothetical protein